MARRNPPRRSITTGSKKGTRAALKVWTPRMAWRRGMRSEVATRGMASVVQSPAAMTSTMRANRSSRFSTPDVDVKAAAEASVATARTVIFFVFKGDPDHSSLKDMISHSSSQQRSSNIALN